MFASTPLKTIESELVTLAGHLAAGTCRFLQLLAEFDARRGWAEPGLRSCAHWLGWRIGLSARTARDHLRVAHALQGLPLTTAAFAEGRVSYSKVRALTRVATPASEEALLGIALHGTAAQLDELVRAARGVLHPQPAEARRALRTSRAADGSLIVRLRIPADRGHALMAAIGAALDDPGLDDPGGGSAEPLPHLPGTDPAVRERALRQGLEHDTGPALDPLAARRLDALLDLVDGAVTARPAQLVVHVRAEESHPDGTGPGDDPTAGPAAWVDGGPPLAPATAARLTCTAPARALLTGRRGAPLHLGRKRRGVSAAQLLALRVRDGGRCVVPGCGAARHLHAHHLRPWALGGPTDLDNLALVCGLHHRLVHEGGYTLARDGDALVFRRPDGTAVPAAGPPTRGRSDRLVADHTRARIDDRTLTPDWAGQRLDLHYAVSVLLPTLQAAA